MPGTTTIYSPHVLVLEGIFALYDPRILALLDLKIFAEADADVCLGRRSTYTINSIMESELMLSSSKLSEMSRKGVEISRAASSSGCHM